MTDTADIIDSHAHIGIQDRSFDQSFESYAARAVPAGIRGVAAFPPVMEIYDRYDYDFQDTRAWQRRRQAANDYLLTAGSDALFVIPYFFIWNDFAVDRLTPRHKGIKWHRHSDEPEYQYETDGCRRALQAIAGRRMPVVYEETLANTVMFVQNLAADIRVIIPHLGGLNGGFEAIARHGLWERPHVYTDTALASSLEIKAYIRRYGHERILFGSDFPFGDPARELDKIRQMGLDTRMQGAILAGNLNRLLADSNREPV